jgi:hypothetical protein
MARTYQTPHKSTSGRFPIGQSAPRHQPEVEVKEDPEEVQLEVEVEEDPDGEEDPEEQPQLYDGTIFEADADGDLVIPPAPNVANDAPPPSRVVPAYMLWVEIQMTWEM